MKKQMMVAAVLATAVVLLPAIPAVADTLSGSRSCAAPRTAYTSSLTGNGGIYHYHDSSHNKLFTNSSGSQWRYYNGGLTSIGYILDYSGGAFDAWGSSCEL